MEVRDAEIRREIWFLPWRAIFLATLNVITDETSTIYLSAEIYREEIGPWDGFLD